MVAVVPRKKMTKLGGTICTCGGRPRNGREAKSCETLRNFLFIYKVIVLEDLALCMENLHPMGPFHYWQCPCSVSSPLNSSSGCVENGRVAFRYWQRSCSISSPLDSSSGRAENGKVVRLAARTPGST